MKVNNIIKFWKFKKIRKILKYLIYKNAHVILPTKVEIGNNVSFVHNAVASVIHENCLIKDNVKIYQNVTIGRQDIWKSGEDIKLEKIVIEDGAVICAGAKILGKNGTLIIGKNSIIGANAVVTCNVGENEIWAGVPARMIKKRDDKSE